jgi:amino acid adenylation domain-containing protein
MRMAGAEDTDVTARLLWLAQRAPLAPAFLAQGRNPLSFGSLARHVHRTAAKLASWGIARGDIVAWANGERSETAVALATLPASSTIGVLNPAATFDALRDAMARMRPKAVVVPADEASPVVRAARALGIAEIRTASEGGEAGAFDLTLARPTASLDARPHVSAGWVGVGVTSGSTGRPKIVSYAHRQVIVTARATGERLAFDPTDISGHLMPLHLAGGIRNALFQALLNGAAVNVLPHADLDAFIDATAAGEVTWTSSSFTMLRELIACLEGGRRFERGRLRYVRVASGRLEPAEMDRLEELLGVPVVTGLASSETGTTAQQGLAAPRKRGSIGAPVETEVRLVDEDGRPAGPGEVGEIHVRGPQLFDGYLDDPALNAASFADGWFRMGDLARFDQDGELHLVGRVKEVINRGGDKIAPLEIDAMLRTIPGVADAAAFGVPHPRLNEEVVAAIVAQPGTALRADEILKRAREVLGANRAPRRIWFVDALPRTDGGKLRRHDLPAWVRHDTLTEASPQSPPLDARRSPIEIALAALWTAVLHVSPIPRDRDFFMLGGDSLRGAQLLEQAQAVFGVAIPLEALFDDAGTLEAMARRIEAQRGLSLTGADGERRPAVPRRSADAALPLSSPQMRAWFLQRLDPASPAYNEARLWRIDGALDIDALRAALAATAMRQPMLRTRFVLSAADPQQVIDPEPHVELEIVALPCDPDDEEERIERAACERTERLFDLAARAPVRWTLFELGGERYALLRVWHHILGDGLSAGLLQRDVSEAYALARAGQRVVLPPLPVDYADYAIWWQNEQRRDERAAALEWWKTRLAQLPILALAPDFRRPRTQSFKGGIVSWRLDKDVAAAMKALGRAHRASTFVTFLSVFAALMSRLTGEEDIAIGTPVAGRPLPELADIIGYFANTLVFRADLAGGVSTASLLARTRDQVRDMLARAEVSFEELVEALRLPRDPARNPLFQVAFALRERDAVDLLYAGTDVRRVPAIAEHAKFDLTLSMIDGPEGIDARWEFCADLFERATIERIARQYETLAASMASAYEAPIATLPLMDDATRDRVLAAATATGRVFPAAMTIHRRFAEQARFRPQAIAIDALDYATLDAAANRLAAELRAQGVASGSVVAVARRSPADIAVAWLAVLKAGAAYLPVDPAVPVERAAFIFADARVRHAVADAALASLFSRSAVSVVQPERDAERIAAHPAADAESVGAPDSAAYVIYTSGSTGTPKGVVIPHRAVLRLVCDTDCAQIRSDDVVAQIANPAFDASTFEFWGALLNGARIVSVPKTTAIAPRALAAAIARDGISVLFLTTALFNSVASDVPGAFAACRCVLFGGEAVEPERVAAVVHAGSPQHLIHVYGPTETTTFATWHEVRDVPPNAATVPIGLPLANTDVHVLRSDFEPAAPGEPGEICIAGLGLALGYLNAPEHAADRFVERSVASRPVGRLYRSGDRGRRRGDGSIEFLGRRDRQVKIRGHRIELEEVEATISLMPQVRAAAVAVEGDTAETRKLVAYLVSSAPSGPPPANLYSELRLRLPEYMLPSQITWLPALPLNASSKLDRGALRPIGEPATPKSSARVPPRDMFEHVLARIWQNLLQVEEIGVFDRFFDNGGESLSAVRLVNAIERETGLAAPLTALFVDDTIAGLARVLRDGAPDLEAPIVSIQDDGGLPPFVFLHGDFTGGGFYSRALAHALGREQPVLIVHPHGLVDPAIPETIEAMAAERVAALRELRPRGPYLLGGHCNGALVAYEMARQLIGQGESVPAVVIIEARAPGGQQVDASAGSGVYMTLEPGGGVRMLAPRDRQSDARLRYLRAIDGYAGGRCATHVVIARSAKLKDARRDLGWSQLTQSVEVHDLPGDHVTLITRHVAELAQVVRGAMDRAIERTAQRVSPACAVLPSS